jgi:hypothetical protein
MWYRRIAVDNPLHRGNCIWPKNSVLWDALPRKRAALSLGCFTGCTDSWMGGGEGRRSILVKAVYYKPEGRGFENRLGE